MKIEKTEVWITCERPVEADGTAVRGFFGNMYRQRPEFHGHRGDELVYRHPLIQYKVFGGTPLVVGLKEGAYLLKALPQLEHLEIYHRKYAIIKQNTISNTRLIRRICGLVLVPANCQEYDTRQFADIPVIYNHKPF